MTPPRTARAAEVDVAAPPALTAREGADGLSAPPVINSLGEFDARVVAIRIRGQAGRIKRCYERELARDPTLGGTVRVEFTILRDGTVAGVTATENTVSPEVGACIVAILGSLYFSPGPVGGSVRYRFPFTFEPGG